MIELGQKLRNPTLNHVVCPAQANHTHTMRNRNKPPRIESQPIHVYTRAQSIAHGTLVDLTTATDDKGQLLCRQAGFKVPIAITRSAWVKTIEAGGTWKPQTGGETLTWSGGQSLTGRLRDLLWVLRVTSGQAVHTDRVHFQVRVDVRGDGRHELVKLWSLCGPGDDARPVITIMLEGED